MMKKRPTEFHAQRGNWSLFGNPHHQRVAEQTEIKSLVERSYRIRNRYHGLAVEFDFVNPLVTNRGLQRQYARSCFELHTVSPARFITTLKRPATTPSARTLPAQIRISQPTLRSHVCAPADGCAVISDTPRRLAPCRGIRNRTLQCRRG